MPLLSDISIRIQNPKIKSKTACTLIFPSLIVDILLRLSLLMFPIQQFSEKETPRGFTKATQKANDFATKLTNTLEALAVNRTQMG